MRQILRIPALILYIFQNCLSLKGILKLHVQKGKIISHSITYKR